MKLPRAFSRLKGFRFPREIVAYAVWAYHRFALGTADVENLLMRTLAAEGMTMVVVTHEMGLAAQVAAQVAFMAKGELVGVDAPARILHQPKDPRTQSFLSAYHERATAFDPAWPPVPPAWRR